ncbi:hypothetical protein AB0E62_35975 [Streptomyces sp. NPDC038707]|uniref:hypothetical protein n=1 Tax=Streptomyces sp. NPDC038707 TaxID=3154329 RepID=UPI0033DA0FD8
MTTDLSRLNADLRDAMREWIAAATSGDAAARLQALLAEPPAGHTATPQPDDWYEAVFDAMACAHPDRCTCMPKEAK